MAQTLVREPLDLESDKNELEQLYSFDDLAAAAAEHLGYTALIKNLPALRAATRDRVSLKQAMADLGVAPFNNRDVARYQTKMARVHTPLTTWALIFSHNFAFGLFIGGLAALSVSGASCLILYAISVVPAWLSQICWGGLVTAMIGCLVGAAFVIATNGKTITYAEWRAIPIELYHRPIPEFALQTAVDIKQRCPEARFVIEELQFKQRTLDPFLAVRDSEGNTYYLEVWNEPRFVQKREP